MLSIPNPLKRWLDTHVLRYVANGLFATTTHYAVLQLNLHVLLFSSAGFANFVASFFGIFVSFVGNRYFVFKTHHKSALQQLTKFGALYVSTALLHCCVLYVWSDILARDPLIGFLIATGLQAVSSYWGAKLVVFKE